VGTSDFFRGYNDDRGRDFAATSLSGMDVYKNPINADKYTIFMHRRMWTAPRSEAAFAPRGRPGANLQGMKLKDEYVTIKRQLRYGDADNCETPIYLVWWAGYPQAAKADAAVADAFVFTFRNVMVFTEPKT